MYVLATHNWFQDLIRTFFFSIDKIVFNFISTIYDLLISIARTSVLSQADIADMADRIYNLLAVFMIFKVTFSLIMYVVNPDDFSDKSKGISKLGINIVFSLAMLVLTPYIFNYAYQFQTIILEDNSLATLIFGKDVANSSDNPINDAGDIISYATITPFLTPNLSLDIGECSNLIVKDNNGVKTFNEGCSGLTFDGSNFATLSNGTDGTLYNLTIDNDNFSETTLKNYIVGVTNSNLALTFRQDLVLAADSNKENYIMDYKYIFSTAVGVVVVLLLISFCMDIGLRSIKLAFFQLIAPIPILSYIDPKSGKDGMFKKWYQMCLKTYLSLFLKLLALYFAIYIISRVDNMVDIVDGSYVSSMWIKIFIIIGALMFAKNFTKILEGLGVKLDGDGKFSLNPLKKFENEALGGKKILRGAAGGAAALGAAGLSGATNFIHRGINTAQRFKNADGTWNKVKSLGSGALTTVGSTIAGATRGGVNAFGKTNKDGKIIKGMWGGYQTSMFSKLLREDNLRKAGLVDEITGEKASLRERISFSAGSTVADLQRYAGVLNRGQMEELEKARFERETSNLQNELSLRKANLTRMKEAHFEPYESAQKQQKVVDQLLEGNSRVKAAKSNWQNAISRGESDIEIERLRQLYKYTKGAVLEAEYNQQGSAINIAVNRHNQMVNEMDPEHRAHYNEITTNISYEQDNNGSFVEYNGNYYEIINHDGYDYFEYNGELRYVSDEDRRYRANTGVNIMGDNDDHVAQEKAVFESSDEFINETNEIQTLERNIEARKAEIAEAEFNNPSSRAKIQNAMRLNKDEQKPGFKPSSNQSSQSRLADNSLYSDFNSNSSQGGHRGGHH